MIFIFSILYIILSAVFFLHWYSGGFDVKTLPSAIFSWLLMHAIAFILFFLIKIL